MTEAKPQIFFVASGDDPSDPSAWKPINLASIEFQIEGEPEYPRIDQVLNYSTECTFAVQKISRQALKLITGRLRLPGDGPLINNGRRSR